VERTGGGGIGDIPLVGRIGSLFKFSEEKRFRKGGTTRCRGFERGEGFGESWQPSEIRRQRKLAKPVRGLSTTVNCPSKSTGGRC